MHGSRRPPAASVVYGAGRDLNRLVQTHLFVVVPNHSGSTFLKEALGTCRATWNLYREGQNVLGYRGPVSGRGGLSGAHKIWAARSRWRAILTDAGAYDWPRNRRAWYFQAWARDAGASVFVVKAPPHVFAADMLARHFPNAKFLFMVRNPYAVCEGICRSLQQRGLAPPDGVLPALAARHAAACLERQRRNIEAHRECGAFFTYEALCAAPERVARRIHALVPVLGDLNLRQRLPVKGRYDEMLTDMNARQIARLSIEQIGAFNRVFRAHRDVLDRFGYTLLDDSR